ncbi:MAG: hypothetical protein ACQKBY_06625 [Verrucomicrobiales bacterium]
MKAIAALALVYIAIRSMFSGFSSLGYRSSSAFLMVFLAIGLFRYSRRFHFGVFIWMGITILVHTLLMKRALAQPVLLSSAIPARPWLDFGIGLIPHILAMTCALALCVRALHRHPKPASAAW